MTTKRDSEERTLQRCLPCWICGKQPQWGAAFLVCPNGHHETCYDEPKGAAAREWNRLQRDKGER